jgi:hypothetical protein
MRKLTYSDLSSLTQYELKLIADECSVSYQKLETFLLDCYNRDVFSLAEEDMSSVETEAYEKGYEEGQKTGYEEGIEGRQEFYDSMIPASKVDQIEKKAWKLGYSDGWTDGISWKEPKIKDIPNYEKYL